MAKSLLESCDKLISDLGILVIGLEVMSLLIRGVSPDRAHVDHAIAELDKGAPLDGDI